MVKSQSIELIRAESLAQAEYYQRELERYFRVHMYKDEINCVNRFWRHMLLECQNQPGYQDALTALTTHNDVDEWLSNFRIYVVPVLLGG